MKQRFMLGKARALRGEHLESRTPLAADLLAASVDLNSFAQVTVTPPAAVSPLMPIEAWSLDDLVAPSAVEPGNRAESNPSASLGSIRDMPIVSFPARHTITSIDLHTVLGGTQVRESVYSFDTGRDWFRMSDASSLTLPSNRSSASEVLGNDVRTDLPGLPVIHRPDGPSRFDPGAWDIGQAIPPSGQGNSGLGPSSWGTPGADGGGAQRPGGVLNSTDSQSTSRDPSHATRGTAAPFALTPLRGGFTHETWLDQATSTGSPATGWQATTDAATVAAVDIAWALTSSQERTLLAAKSSPASANVGYSQLESRSSDSTTLDTVDSAAAFRRNGQQFLGLPRNVELANPSASAVKGVPLSENSAPADDSQGRAATVDPTRVRFVSASGLPNEADAPLSPSSLQATDQEGTISRETRLPIRAIEQIAEDEVTWRRLVERFFEHAQSEWRVEQKIASLVSGVMLFACLQRALEPKDPTDRSGLWPTDRRLS